MKKYLLLFVFVSFIIPQVTFASWWNPFGWGVFQTRNNQTQVLENRIKQLENTLASTTTENGDKAIIVDEQKPQPQSVVQPKKENPSPKAVNPSVVAPKVNTAIYPVQIAQTAKDFRAECKLTSRKDIDEGEQVKASIEAFEKSAYDVVWDKKYFTRQVDNYSAFFTVEGIGNHVITATVKRKSDGFSKIVKCPTILVPCREIGCLSKDEQKIKILNIIIDQINGWYDSPGGAISVCSQKESVIRAFEYEYTLLGGVNVPGFSKEIDCASNLAPKAYQYKIKFLINSLQ